MDGFEAVATVLRHATWAGAVTVEVNVEVTPAEVDHRLPGPGGMVLPRLVRAAFGLSSGHPLAGE